jgi:signal transduction histidine kinase
MQTKKLIGFGVVTWLIVGVSSASWELRGGGLFRERTAMWALAFVAFLLLFLTRRWTLSPRLAMAARVATSLVALLCIWLEPNGFQPILLVIFAASLGGGSMRVAVAWIAVQTIAFAVISSASAGDNIPVSVAYFAFQIFAASAVHMAHSEALARQELARTNAELRMTTELLDITSRNSERLRIARDLHDLLGHHLAALSINLEVASHLADGDARASIEKSRAITRLLLGDVRDLVSSMRDDEPIDLAASVLSLRDAIAAPMVHVDIDGSVAIGDAAVAHAALRAVQEIITNAVRHAGARNLWLRLRSTDDALDIDARDDGGGTDVLYLGNGLRGMRERVEQVRGSVDVTSSRGNGFAVHVRLPLAGAAA